MIMVMILKEDYIFIVSPPEEEWSGEDWRRGPSIGRRGFPRVSPSDSNRVSPSDSNHSVSHWVTLATTSVTLWLSELRSLSDTEVCLWPKETKWLKTSLWWEQSSGFSSWGFGKICDPGEFWRNSQNLFRQHKILWFPYTSSFACTCAQENKIYYL